MIDRELLEIWFMRKSPIVILIDPEFQIVRRSAGWSGSRKAEDALCQRVRLYSSETFSLEEEETQSSWAFSPLPCEYPQPGSFLLVGIPAPLCKKKVNQFLIHLAHDLRTPISAIYSWMELLLRGGLSHAEESKEAQQIIFGEVQRLASHLNKVSLVSHLDAQDSRPEFITILSHDLINSVVDAMIPFAQQRKVLVFVEDRGLEGEIVADANLLQVALKELLENAIWVSPENTEVSLFLTSTQAGHEFCFQDAGPGLSESELLDLQKVFSPYLRKREKHGLGLGLPIANLVFKMHNGSLKRAQNGTDFQIRAFLPRIALER